MTAPKESQRFLLLLFALAVVLLALVIAPLLGALFAAAVFAVVMQPLQSFLAKRLGGRPRVAAGMLTVGLALLMLVPLAWLSVIVVRQVSLGIDEVVAVVEERGMDGLVNDLPEPLRPYAEQLEQKLPAGILPMRIDASAPDPQPGGAPPAIGSLLRTVGSIVSAMLAGRGGFVIEMGVLAVGLYFLLAEGRALVDWVIKTAPLPAAQSQQFAAEFADVTVAVFVSTVTTAVLQGLLGALGYLIAGVPNMSVWVFLTLVAAFIPAIGGAVVVCAIGLYYILSGESLWGYALIGWGVTAVGMVDNIAKPMLARRRLKLPGSVLFFSMLGGIATFGVMGVVAGPLAVSFFLVVVRALGGRPSAAAQE